MKQGSRKSLNRLYGTPASRGIAFGYLAFLKPSAKTAVRRRISDPNSEIKRFDEARAKASAQLGSLYEASLERLGEQNAVLFQIHQLMLDDPDYVSGVHEKIRTDRINAEYAVDLVAKRFAKMFRAMDNDYIKGRDADVLDVSRRVINILSSDSGDIKVSFKAASDNMPIILATEDLSPSQTVQLDKYAVTGIAVSGGSTRSHTVIFARTMGIPSVISLGDNLSKSLEGSFAILDGSLGLLIVNPDAKTIASYREKKHSEDILTKRLEEFRGKETVTLSGRKIRLCANIGNAGDLDVVQSSDAEGIGLFRSEYIYLNSDDFPTEDAQFKIYRELLEGMPGKLVIIRTLDIGADKTAPYFTLKPEDNPAMGMRAIRLCITRPEIFKTQLRALYRASVYGKLAIMFPMISSLEEVKICLKICADVRRELVSSGIDIAPDIEHGIMIETPAAALISDELAPYVDFFSIGTNDLTQFTLAVDRQNAELGRFLNPYHHAVKRLLEMTVKNAHEAGIWVGVCGELAADAGFTRELIDMRVDEISVAPASVLMLRAKISTLE